MMRVLACVLFALAEAWAQSANSGDADRSTGEELLAQGFAEQALPYLERAGTDYAQAVALIELNRLPEGLHKLVTVYRRRSNDRDLLFHLGEAAGSLMQQAFDRLIRMYPDSPRAREVQSRKDGGRREGAPADVEALDRLLARYFEHRDDPEALFQMGERSGRVVQYAFGALVRLHPNSARALELQARGNLGQGRGDLAEPLFRKALQLNPGLAGAHLALGRIRLEARGDLDGAEQEFRAEARMRPGDAEAAWRLGAVLLKKGQAKEALAELERSDRLKPNMLETLLEVGKAYGMENRSADAEKAYRKILEIEDRDEVAAAAHLQLSQMYRKQGRVAESEEHLKRYRELSAAK